MGSRDKEKKHKKEKHKKESKERKHKKEKRSSKHKKDKHRRSSSPSSSSDSSGDERPNLKRQLAMGRAAARAVREILAYNAGLRRELREVRRAAAVGSCGSGPWRPLPCWVGVLHSAARDGPRQPATALIN